MIRHSHWRSPALRTTTSYHCGWFSEGQLIANADRLAGIPGAIIQGRYDVATPAITAYDLHQAWPQADFTIAPVAGHAFSEPGILEALVAATDRFALQSDMTVGGK